ncbi:MAG: DUF2442 domain-containing protein [Elusimicrobia bacterium]|nr:DUF2442 domain-containing protein [Elusimicrobiota bacterium]
MRPSAPGTATSGAEVLAVVPTGIWLGVNGEEFFLPFSEFPWFSGADASAVKNVRLLRGTHLRWPELDVDLELDSVVHPGRYPLKDQTRRPGKPRAK